MNPAEEAGWLARLLAKTNEYLSIPCVTGAEGVLLDHVAADFQRLNMTVERTDGLVIVRPRAPRPGKLHLFVRADRRGGVLDDDGQAQLTGGPSAQGAPDRLIGQAVYAFNPATGAHLSYGGITTITADDEGSPARLEISDLAGAPAKSPLAFDGRLDLTTPGYVYGPLADTLNLAMVRIAAEMGADASFIFAGRGAHDRVADRMLDWAEAGGLDPTRQLIGLCCGAFEESAAAQAGAVVLRRRDSVASFDARAVARLERAAEAARAPILFKDAFIEAENTARKRRNRPVIALGDTEIGRITARSRGAYTGASLQLPVFAHAKGLGTTPGALRASLRTVIEACRMEEA
ncbi:MAG: hypothetical protein AAFX09_10790 [Pseudomonadota bacterium]